MTLTDPNDAGSAFYLQSISRPTPANPDGYMLRMNTVIGVSYEIETSSDGVTWQQIEGSRWTAVEPIKELVITPAGKVRFWRAVVIP